MEEVKLNLTIYNKGKEIVRSASFSKEDLGKTICRMEAIAWIEEQLTLLAQNPFKNNVSINVPWTEVSKENIRSGVYGAGVFLINLSFIAGDFKFSRVRLVSDSIQNQALVVIAKQRLLQKTIKWLEFYIEPCFLQNPFKLGLKDGELDDIRNLENDPWRESRFLKILRKNS